MTFSSFYQEYGVSWSQSLVKDPLAFGAKVTVLFPSVTLSLTGDIVLVLNDRYSLGLQPSIQRSANDLVVSSLVSTLYYRADTWSEWTVDFGLTLEGVAMVPTLGVARSFEW